MFCFFHFCSIQCQLTIRLFIWQINWIRSIVLVFYMLLPEKSHSDSQQHDIVYVSAILWIKRWLCMFICLCIQSPTHNADCIGHSLCYTHRGEIKNTERIILWTNAKWRHQKWIETPNQLFNTLHFNDCAQFELAFWIGVFIIKVQIRSMWVIVREIRVNSYSCLSIFCKILNKVVIDYLNFNQIISNDFRQTTIPC